MKTIQLAIKSLLGTLFFLLVLFISAGRINYWQGWLYTAICILSVFLNAYALKDKADLAAERAVVKSGTKSWDKKILGLSAVILIITYIVAGLDSGRYHWSPPFNGGVNATGAALIIAGEVIFLMAQKENRFFSSVMRIQTDRGHTVCDTGIYKIIRHPAYFGNIITALGIPLILGSLWGFIPSAVSIILVIIRTYLEDRTLIKELDGYSDYSSRTRFRLLPYIW
ncbi:MAG TPA: isoprenylcysteine carboxyl methyltransferase [Bacteroidales bacterium]|jgi:protein-S-isoprenylcysteine O-methyltransferase Ste14|nr:isoprenylcysteine carboxyl methyltransferase [Bacteroidales bacterium]HBZ21382.1 isoprenylcysteine carboxyl methyltransferase [Bacteroidales bacterium]